MSDNWIKFSSALDNIPDINYGFFTNNGGVSSGIYESLNTGQGSNDAKQNVMENRRRVAASLGTTRSRLLSLHQYHSTHVIIADKTWDIKPRPKADAIVTNIPLLACSALSADCSPVLFVDPKARVIGAAHAGWRGALGGVTDTTIKAMRTLGAKRGNIRAAIGPCLSHAHFEVGPEFVHLFLNESMTNADLFVSGQKDRSYFDIKAYLTRKLLRAGLARVSAAKDCTYTQENEFFSYRRNTHAGISGYGRNISAIMLK